jgi:hypothetical protein
VGWICWVVEVFSGNQGCFTFRLLLGVDVFVGSKVRLSVKGACTTRYKQLLFRDAFHGLFSFFFLDNRRSLVSLWHLQLSFSYFICKTSLLRHIRFPWLWSFPSIWTYLLVICLLSHKLDIKWFPFITDYRLATPKTLKRVEPLWRSPVVAFIKTCMLLPRASYNILIRLYKLTLLLPSGLDSLHLVFVMERELPGRVVMFLPIGKPMDSFTKLIVIPFFRVNYVP